jgi:hypothetical protein
VVKVKDLITKLQEFDPEKTVLCQLLPANGEGAWNMFHEFLDCEGIPYVQLAITHPTFKELPEIEEED